MVTETQAEKVFSEFKKINKNVPYIGEASLIKDWQFIGWSNGEAKYYQKVPYAIVWEAGPSDWAYFTNSWKLPKGIEVGAYTTYALAIFEE